MPSNGTNALCFAFFIKPHLGLKPGAFSIFELGIKEISVLISYILSERDFLLKTGRAVLMGS